MANEFSVTPLGGLDVGAKLTSVLEGGKQNYRLQQWHKTAPDIIKGGDPDAIANLMIEYPEMAETMVKAAGYKQQRSIMDMVNTAKGILLGQVEPSQAIGEHIQKAQSSGEDVSRPLTTLGKTLEDPAHAQQWAQKILALYAPDEYKELRASMGESPEATANSKDFDKWQSLPEGPEKDAFAKIIGISAKDTEEKATTKMREFDQWAAMPEGPEKETFGQVIGVVVGGEADGLTPDGIEMAAQRYAVDGTLPPLGMGKAAAALRTEIINRAAQVGKERGMSGEEMRQFQIGTSANKQALGQLMKQKVMVGAFEKNFVKNAGLALELSGKFDRTGTPLVNKWLNAGKRSLAGDPALAKYDQAIKTTVNEYTKIISGSMGNTATTEGEIKKIESLLNSAQTPEQVESVIKFMLLETQNRRKGFDEQELELRTGMKLPAVSGEPELRRVDNSGGGGGFPAPLSTADMSDDELFEAAFGGGQ